MSLIETIVEFNDFLLIKIEEKNQNFIVQILACIDSKY